MKPKGAIILLAIGQTLVWAALFYIFPALLLAWEADLGWSRTEITGALALATLVSGLVAPFVGQVIDGGYGTALMVGSSLVGAGGLAALSQVSTLPQFYIIWFVIGLAMAGSLYEPCFAIVTRAYGEGAKRAITTITLIAGFAGTISFPAAIWGADVIGWRHTVLIAAAIVVVIVAPLFWFATRALYVPPKEPTQKQETARGFLTEPAFLFLAAAFCCAALVRGSTFNHLLPYLHELIVPAGVAVTIAAMFGPMQVLGRIALMIAGGYVSSHAIALTAFVFMTASIAVLTLGGGSVVSLYGFVFLFGSAYGTMSILRPVLVRSILGAEKFGAKSGALALPYLVGLAVSPFLGSIAWGIGGYGFMFWCAFLLGVAGTGFYIAANWGRPSEGAI